MFSNFKAIQNKGIVELSRRFWVSALLTVFIFLISAENIPFISSFIISWLQFILTTIVIIWGGWPIIKRGRLSIINRHLTMFSIVTIAIIFTYGYGVLLLFFPIFFPAIVDFYVNAHSLFKISAILTAVVLFEQFIERYFRSKIKIKTYSIQHIPRPSVIKLTRILSQYLSISVLVIAILLFLFTAKEKYAFISAVSVLVIACPHAITLSASMPILFGIERAQKFGAVFMNTASLEKLGKINVLVFDQSCSILPSASIALKMLRKKGIHIIMTTNEDISTIQSIVTRLGIEAIETEMTLQQRIDLIKRLQQQGFIVGME